MGYVSIAEEHMDLVLRALRLRHVIPRGRDWEIWLIDK